MKKMYVTPEMEIVETEMACFLAGSDPNQESGDPDAQEFGAPGMMSFDDGEDFIDEDNI